jgi:hypothetical protein
VEREVREARLGRHAPRTPISSTSSWRLNRPISADESEWHGENADMGSRKRMKKTIKIQTAKERNVIYRIPEFVLRFYF